MSVFREGCTNWHRIVLTGRGEILLGESLRAGGFPLDVRIDKPNKETVAKKAALAKGECRFLVRPAT